MKYMAVMDDGEEIFFSDLKSAVQGSKEMGFPFFFPRKGIFSSEKQENVIMNFGGSWQSVPLSDLKCTCGCQLS